MISICLKIIPKFLHDWHVDKDKALAIGKDILCRAEAFSLLDQRQRKVLVAPSIEEVFDYEPTDSSLELKGSVLVVVRNSQLEEAHVQGLVNDSGLEGITRMTAAALSHFLNLPQEVSILVSNPFSELETKYPRAWACFAAIAGVLPEGGRREYAAPKASLPDLPTEDEIVEAEVEMITNNNFCVTLSGIDPRIDKTLMNILRNAVEYQFVMVDKLSSFSRNSDKLFRIIDFLLAHNVTIMTTNYMLCSHYVCVRRRSLVKPDRENPYKGLRERRGLSGAHRRAAVKLMADGQN